MCCDALDSTNELSDFLLAHVSRFCVIANDK